MSIGDKQLYQWGGWVRSGKNPLELSYPSTSILYRMMMFGIRPALLHMSASLTKLGDYGSLTAKVVCTG